MMPREADIGTNAKCKKCKTYIEMTAKGWMHSTWAGTGFVDHQAEPAPPEAPKCGSGTKPSPFEKLMPIQQIDMKPYVVAMHQYITEHTLACGDIQLNAMLDHMMHQWVFELQAHMASVQHKEIDKEKTGTQTVRLHQDILIPSTWWQHFKLVWFPEWAMKRWPVKMQQIIVEKSETVKTKWTEKHTTKVCPHIQMTKGGPNHLAWMAGDSRYDEVEEAKEVWRLRNFIMRLIRDDYGPSNLSYECSPKVHEEAKKALDGK